MARPPKISVLIPSYNYADYLPRTVRSVQAQTEQDFELLILDDGSSDASFEVAQQLAAADPRIRCWQQPNAGLITTLNRLAAAAQGEFVAQIDADDIYMPERFALGLADMAADPQLAVTFTSFAYIDANDVVTGLSPHHHLQHLAGRELASLLVVRNRVCACTALMRRSALAAIGPFARQFTHVQDWDRWLRLSLVGPIKLRAEIGARYRWHSRNQSHAQMTSQQQQHAIAVEMAPKVIAHHRLGDDVWLQVHAQLAALARGYSCCEQALGRLCSGADGACSAESERIFVLQCLAVTRRTDEARGLARAMQGHRHQLHPSSRAVLDHVSAQLAHA